MKPKLFTFVHKLLNWKREDKAQTLVEYALILVLVCAIIFTLLAIFGDSVRAVFGKVTATLSVASS